MVAALALGGCGPEGGEPPTEEPQRTGGVFGGQVQSRGSGGGESGGASPSSGEMSTAPGADSDDGGPQAQPLDITDMGHTVGSRSAPIRVVEFSDFGCGYCRRFHEETYPAIHEEYVETGRVIWKYIPFVLGIFPNGDVAALAGECVLEQGERGGEAFPGFRDRLFEDQGAWRDSDRPVDVFVRVAEDEGVNGERLRRCVEKQETAEQVARNNAVGREVGIRGTPGFIINGATLQGAQPLEVFRSIFDQIDEPDAD